MKFVHKIPTDNILAFVPTMAWRRPGDKLLSDQWWLLYWHIYASLSPSELKNSEGTSFISIKTTLDKFYVWFRNYKYVLFTK